MTDVSYRIPVMGLVQARPNNLASVIPYTNNVARYEKRAHLV